MESIWSCLGPRSFGVFWDHKSDIRGSCMTKHVGEHLYHLRDMAGKTNVCDGKLALHGSFSSDLGLFGSQERLFTSSITVVSTLSASALAGIVNFFCFELGPSGYPSYSCLHSAHSEKWTRFTHAPILLSSTTGCSSLIRP
jgi:hypothetical protein